jgi:NAD(P)-dependent dehydrogenase (short-subunit alcohol dehydrogenase family)
VEAVQAAFGRLDVLVNAAGIIQRADVLATSEEQWDRTLAVNVKSVFLLARAAIPAMLAAGGGAIVNIASNWGLVGGARAAAYCASKGAVVTLTKALALDHGHQGIRVNCLCPGDVDTPMLRDEARQLGLSWEAFREEAAANPLGRVGTPEDVAHAALFLASSAAAFVNGAALVVDGGFVAG